MATSTDLRTQVYQANLDLVAQGLVLLTWGNASAVDRAQDVMFIKPSGVAYEALRPEHIVAVRLSTGEVLPGSHLRPSSDTATHLVLYRAWPQLGGIVHTHSEFATAVAQAGSGIPALGTTHADYFDGDIPCTRPLTQAEVEGDYEAATGRVIVERFAPARADGPDPLAMPGVLIAQHAPFAWGTTVAQAVYHAVVLERLARMYIHTCAINPHPARVPDYLLAKHYQRKHGPRAYYGQGKGH